MTTHIEINGLQKHRFNSDGKLIHHTDEGIKKFHEWANGTELKDEQGRPQIVYHGTSSDKDFKDFKVPKNGAWVTKSQKGASEYAESNDSQNIKYDGHNFNHINTASRVLPVYVKSNKPHNMTDEDHKIINVEKYKTAQGRHFDTLRDKGFDSIDHGNGVHSIIGGPHQIKSAMGNNGAFNKVKKGMNESDEYKGEHSSPCPESGSPIHNLKGTYPDDFYTHPNHYADGLPHDNESLSVLRAVKDKPKMAVKIYRAVPKVDTHQEKLDQIQSHKAYILKHGKVPSGVTTNLNSSQYYTKLNADHQELEKNKPEKESPKLKINNGDWVTASKTYAHDHGKGNLKNNYRILSKTVNASELFTSGDSIHEFGYHPKEKTISECVELEYINMILEK